MRTNRRLVILVGLAVFILNCRTLEVLFPGQPAAYETKVSRATFTTTPKVAVVATSTTTATKRPSTATVRRTATQTLVPTLPSPVPSSTFTISPWEYIIDPLTKMETAPNCETVYFKGKIIDMNGEPIDGVVVELAFYDNKPTKVSGRGEDPGEFGFSPLAPSSFHSPITFVLRLVRSERDRTAVSEALTINFVDCKQAGQFTKIQFKKTR